MDVQKYRDDALERLNLFRERFKGEDENFPPIKFARRWFEAFDKTEIDINEIAEIVREAEKIKYNYEIAFGTFCNTMREIYHSLWEESLRSENE